MVSAPSVGGGVLRVPDPRDSRRAAASFALTKSASPSTPQTTLATTLAVRLNRWRGRLVCARIDVALVWFTSAVGWKSAMIR